MPTTRISASYKRTVKTGDYYSATVENGFDEEVTYATQTELDTRRTELRNIAMTQLLEDLELLLSKLGASEKRVFVNPPRQVNSTVVGSALDEWTQMPITSELIEDIFGIPRDGRNIQDESEEEVALINEQAKVSFAQKIEELQMDVSKKSTVITDIPVVVKVDKKDQVAPKPQDKKSSSSMFSDIFDEEPKDATVKAGSTVSKEEATPVKVDIKPPDAPVRAENTIKMEEVKPKLPLPDPTPIVTAPVVPTPTPIIEDIVTEDDDSEDGPCNEWTSSDKWLIDSPAPKYNKFYFEKQIALNPGSGSILPGGEIDFTKYFNELADLNCDITISTYDLEVIYQKMQFVQQLRERCKHIQLHASQQYYLWERYIELFHGILCRVEYERGKQDGIYYEHMRDMEHYYCSLKALHRNADQVMRTLDGAFECLSRQVTIAMPMKDIERYSAASVRTITPEQKKYDAVTVSTKPSKNSHQGESGPINWGQ